MTKLTEEGNAALVAISPDGKYILSLMSDRNGLASLWLRNVPTNSNTQVQPPADVYYNGLRFSPDGNYLYFVRSDPGNVELKYLYRAPLLGGTAEKLAEDVDSNITFSPDGRRIAFMRYDNPEPGKYRLIVRSLDGGQETVLTGGSNSQGLYSPAWSPDGKTHPLHGESAGQCSHWTDGGRCRQWPATPGTEFGFCSRQPDLAARRQRTARAGADPVFEFQPAADRVCRVPRRQDRSPHARYQQLF